MQESAFHKEDKIGLLVALALHVLLALALVLQMFFTPQPFSMPQRVSVSLASEVSLEASAPNPALETMARSPTHSILFVITLHVPSCAHARQNFQPDSAT